MGALLGVPAAVPRRRGVGDVAAVQRAASSATATAAQHGAAKQTEFRLRLLILLGGEYCMRHRLRMFAQRLLTGTLASALAVVCRHHALGFDDGMVVL